MTVMPMNWISTHYADSGGLLFSGPFGMPGWLLATIGGIALAFVILLSLVMIRLSLDVIAYKRHKEGESMPHQDWLDEDEVP